MKPNANLIFLGNSYLASTIAQEKMIPFLLRSRGQSVTIETCYAPGQSLAGHVLNNQGEITRQQQEGIEAGRIGGWFSDEKCEFFVKAYKGYQGRLDRALAARRYDAAIVLPNTSDCSDPDITETFRYAEILIGKLRNNNPSMEIIIDMPWAGQDHPELLPQFHWIVQSIALKYGCRVAPVGEAFARSKSQRPELGLHRSLKDNHQNEVSSFLIAYTLIAALWDCSPVGLPGYVEGLDPEKDCPEGRFALEEGMASFFQQIAWESYLSVKEVLARAPSSGLPKPVIAKPVSDQAMADADHRVLVIGNSYFDADGALWKEWMNSYKDRDGWKLHVETHCDDAATLESILANNEGRLTSRQQGILDAVQANFDKMGQATYDRDALDGMGDYPYAMAVKAFASRKGKLDQALAKPVPWDYVIIQVFRGALDPTTHDFFASGRTLIEKIRQAHPEVPILIMETWPARGTSEGAAVIHENSEKLAQQTGTTLIPTGQAWQKHAARGVDLYRDLYTPNRAGIQAVTECLREHVKFKQ